MPCRARAPERSYGSRARRRLFTADTRRRITAVVREIERQTSAEIVVSVAPASARYLEPTMTAGVVAAIGMLLLVVLHPKPVRDEAIVLDVVLAFVVAAVSTDKIDPLRRRMLTHARVVSETARAAKSEFVDRGIARTKGRTGILVYVSSFERRVEVVSDIGVERSVDTGAWRAALRTLEASISAGADIDRFVSALRGVGTVLARGLPREKDDENELPDEVVA